MNFRGHKPINIPDEMDDVPEELKEKAKNLLNERKEYREQILKFQSMPKKTDFFDAAMLTPNNNNIIKEILEDK